MNLYHVLILTKSDLNNSGDSTIILNLKNTANIESNWDKTINGYQNPFTYTPQSANYKPDWGLVEVELDPNTEYVFSFTPGSYETEVRFRVCIYVSSCSIISK